MPNDRLRDVLLSKGLTPEDVAGRLGVDPKTVERWITTDRTPYPRHRHAIAVMAGESETYLWPGALPSQRRAEVARSEIVQVYPHRNSVPADLWDALLEKATTYIDILVYVGMFMTEKPDLIKAIREKGENGARVRLLFGDRNAPAVTQRSIDEGIGEHTIAAKIDLLHAMVRVGVDGDGQPAGDGHGQDHRVQPRLPPPAHGRIIPIAAGRPGGLCRRHSSAPHNF